MEPGLGHVLEQPGEKLSDLEDLFGMPSVPHDTGRYANNRAEVSHQPTRQRLRQMRRFRSAAPAQRFLSVHGVILNLFRVGRHLLRPVNHRMLRARSFLIWSEVTCA